MREEIIGDARLILGDCLQVLPQIESVDAVVTSPPYGQQRDYGQIIEDWRALVSGALEKVPCHEGTQILVNLGLIHKDGHVVRYWDDLISDMTENNWRLFGWYVWDKLDGLPGDWNGRLAPSHEWVFHFNKNPRHPEKIIATKWAGSISHGTGLRRADGTTPGHYTNNGKPVSSWKIADSVIRCSPHKTNDEARLGHPAVYPVSFAEQVAASYSSKDEIVLDPFMGSGTTGVACVKLGRKFIGIEIEPKYFEISCKRIAAAYAQPDMFIEAEKQKPAEQLEMIP